MSADEQAVLDRLGRDHVIAAEAELRNTDPNLIGQAVTELDPGHPGSQSLTVVSFTLGSWLGEKAISDLQKGHAMLVIGRVEFDPGAVTMVFEDFAVLIDRKDLAAAAGQELRLLMQGAARGEKGATRWR